MNAVIGLVESNDDLDRALRGLRAAGLSQNRIDLLDNAPTISEHVSCICRYNTLKAASIGAGLAGSFYAVLGISAAHCALMSGFSVLWSASTAAAFLLAGLGLGALGGAIIVRTEAEQQAHFYLDGVRRSAVAVWVWVEDHQTRTATRALRESGACGVMACMRTRRLLPNAGCAVPQPT